MFGLDINQTVSGTKSVSKVGEKNVDKIQSVKGQSIFWTKIVWIKYRMHKK